MMKKYGKYAALVALAAVIGVAGGMAYFTATDNVTNNFEVYDLDVTVTEADWDNATDTDGDGVPDFAEDLTSNETIKKTPIANNVGTTDQFVFAKVTVPFKNIVVADLDGTKHAQENVELFTWNTETVGGAINATPQTGTGAVNEGWILLPAYTKVVGENVEYVYAYATKGVDGAADAMKALPAGESTTALFNSVTACNAIEDQIDDLDCSLRVDVYAIQAGDLDAAFNEVGTTVPSEVYDIYLEQNK